MAVVDIDITITRETIMRSFLPTMLLATIFTVPAAAQEITRVSTIHQAGVTTTLFSVTPRTQVAAADYAKLTADALNYRIAASTLAARKGQRDDVKAFARSDAAAAKREQGALFAALKNKDRTIARPSSSLSSQRSASLDLLKKAPGASFDNLYLTQMADAAPAMWALQKGYADDGADPVLRQVATISVPSTERGFRSAKGLMPASLATAR